MWFDLAGCESQLLGEITSLSYLSALSHREIKCSGLGTAALESARRNAQFAEQVFLKSLEAMAAT